MGAAVVLEARKIWIFGGQAMALVIINLIFTFTVSGISIGGHLGGLAGGALCALAFSSFRRTPAVATLSMVAVGVLSVAVAAFQVS
jgi:membrane associated rhomboid family serine protease